MPGVRWFAGATLNYAEHLVGTDEDLDTRRRRRPLADPRADRADVRASCATRSPGPAPASSASASGPATASSPTCPTSPRRCRVRRRRQPRRRLGELRAGVRRTQRRRPLRPDRAQGAARGRRLRLARPLRRPPRRRPGDPRRAADARARDRRALRRVQRPRRGRLGRPARRARRRWPFDPVAFDHPLYVLFSSGTTGLPKAIVHGHGGMLVEHLKSQSLGWDMKPGGRLLWFTTTAWMMWNALVSTLLVRASIVMIDGDPMWPDLTYQWSLAQETQPTLMGVSPTFLMNCAKAGLHPAQQFDLSSLRVLGCAGAPLPAEGYRYVYDELDPSVMLLNGSGGTDVCTGLVSGSMFVPVYEGEISGPGARGRRPGLRRERPAGGRRARRARHHPADAVDAGALLERPGRRALPRGVLRPVPGRLAPGRLDPLHRATAAASSPGAPTRRSTAPACASARARSTPSSSSCPRSRDSLVVHLEDDEGGPGELILFVALADGADARRRAARDGRRRAALANCRRATSPTRSWPCPSIPRTLTGKKLETPVKRILQGRAGGGGRQPRRAGRPVRRSTRFRRHAEAASTEA